MPKQLSLEPRGIRNNNPGNIRYSPHNLWHGMSGIDDRNFIRFSQPYYGLRALRILLIHYNTLAHCVFLSDYIRRWAPPSENDTISYIDSVCEHMLKDPHYTIRIPEDLPALMKAIIIQENGFCPYRDNEIAEPNLYYPIKH